MPPCRARAQTAPQPPAAPLEPPPPVAPPAAAPPPPPSLLGVKWRSLSANLCRYELNGLEPVTARSFVSAVSPRSTASRGVNGIINSSVHKQGRDDMPNLGWRQSSKAKAKIAAANLGRHHSLATRLKISASNIGKHSDKEISPEHRAAVSAAKRVGRSVPTIAIKSAMRTSHITSVSIRHHRQRSAFDARSGGSIKEICAQGGAPLKLNHSGREG